MSSGVFDGVGEELKESEKESIQFEDELGLDEMTTLASIMPPHPEDLGTGSSITIRGEEVGLIIGVFMLWFGAIALFINRWGKIRSLEPYQPKFNEEHRPSGPVCDPAHAPLFPKSFSKLNLLTEENPHFSKCRDPVVGGLAMRSFGIPTGVLTSGSVAANHEAAAEARARLYRQRQNSLFTTHALCPGRHSHYTNKLSRRTRSAIDLPSLILSEEFFERVESVRRNSRINAVSHV